MFRLFALVEDMLLIELLASHQIYDFIGLFIVLALNPLYFIQSGIPVWNFNQLSCLERIILHYQIIVDKLHFV